MKYLHVVQIIRLQDKVQNNSESVVCKVCVPIDSLCARQTKRTQLFSGYV